MTAQFTAEELAKVAAFWAANVDVDTIKAIHGLTTVHPEQLPTAFYGPVRDLLFQWAERNMHYLLEQAWLWAGIMEALRWEVEFDGGCCFVESPDAFNPEAPDPGAPLVGRGCGDHPLAEACCRLALALEAGQ